MQPPNLGIDPAVNLWGSSNSSNNNIFSNTTVSSPEGSGSNKDGTSSLNPNIFNPMGGKEQQANQGPQFSADSSGGFGRNDENAGEVFMGLSSPLPGGVPAWKWNNAASGNGA